MNKAELIEYHRAAALKQLPVIFEAMGEKVTVTWDDEYECIMIKTDCGMMSAYPGFRDGFNRELFDGWQLDIEVTSPGDRWNPPEADAKTIADKIHSPCNLAAEVLKFLLDHKIACTFEAIPAEKLGILSLEELYSENG